MSDLKPCPFCGSEKITIEWEHCDPQCRDDTNRRWFAECTQCSCQGPFCQKEPEVAAKWNNQSRLTAAETRVKELERTLRDKGVRNLINVIDRTCPKCGHDTTEDGCLNCVLVRIDSEILANETGMIDARDHGRWEQYNRLEGGKSELLSLKQFATDLRAELDKLKGSQ